jgi:hypothetical protein
MDTTEEFQRLIEFLRDQNIGFYARGQRERVLRFGVRRARDLPKATLKFLRSKWLGDDTFALTCSLDMDCDDCAPPTESFDDSPFWADLSLRSCAFEINRWIDDFVFAANLAMPACASLGGVFIFRGRELVDSFPGSFPGPLYGARHAVKELGWPPLQLLDINQTWIWLQRQEGFRERVGGGPTGRAINALTHISSGKNSEAVDLMWALVGLEALYATGRSSLLEQLRDRSRLLLGDCARAAKLVSSMYEIRSRFVHGDLDFIGEHPMRETPDAFPQSAGSTTRRATHVAVAMLVASLQELVRRNWSGVRFSTTFSSA